MQQEAAEAVTAEAEAEGVVWQRATCPERGRDYFYTVTGETRWDPPGELLYRAAFEGDPGAVAALLSYATAQGSNPGLAAGRIPGRSAAHTRVRLVLDRLGAAADYALPEGGATSLYVACECGRPEVARHLVEWRADPNLKRHDGATPLLAACSGPEATRHELASLLVRAGARPDPAALRYAVHSGRRGASTPAPMCSLCTHCLLTVYLPCGAYHSHSRMCALSTHCLLTVYALSN